MRVTAPGFYEMTSAEYHADPCEVPSLSRSLAHTMIDQSPAHAFGEHPNLGRRSVVDASEEMDFGDVAHSLILGRGKNVREWPEDSWRGKEAAQFWDKALAEGCTPILKKNLNRAKEMAECALGRLEKLGLSDIFNDEKSELKNETVVIWKEEDIWLRAMIDAPRLERGVIYDLKTTVSAHPKACVARMAPMGYDMQDVWYRRGVCALRPLLNGRLRFIFIFVETKYPFAVTPVELNGEFKTIAQSRVSRAVELWRRCMATQHWPAYTNSIVVGEPKPWLLDEEFGADSVEQTMRKI